MLLKGINLLIACLNNQPSPASLSPCSEATRCRKPLPCGLRLIIIQSKRLLSYRAVRVVSAREFGRTWLAARVLAEPRMIGQWIGLPAVLVRTVTRPRSCTTKCLWHVAEALRRWRVYEVDGSRAELFMSGFPADGFIVAISLLAGFDERSKERSRKIQTQKGSNERLSILK